MIDTETLKLSTSLLALVEAAGGTPRKVGGQYRCACPIHGGKDTSAFEIYKNETRWRCWSGDCGSGDSIAFVMAWQGIGFIQAVEYLGGGRKIDPEEARKMAEARVAYAKAELEEKQREYDEATNDLAQARSWERYHDNLEKNNARKFYRARGIDDVWQDIWKLGYNPVFRATTEGGIITTPSLTLPIFDTGWQIKNIRNRLLNPWNPKDKYRPEREGLPTFPFMCNPDIGYDVDTLLFWEGEFKAGVLYITLDMPNVQVIGISGKNHWRSVADKVKPGQRVFIGFDPGAEAEAVKFAKALPNGAGIISLSEKVDDAIVEYSLDKAWAASLLRSARPVR